MNLFVVTIIVAVCALGCAPKTEADTPATPAPAAQPSAAPAGGAGGAGTAEATMTEAGKNVDSYMGSKVKEAEAKAAKKAKSGK